jgi:cytochrome oxidase assembly protein ShyY1
LKKIVKPWIRWTSWFAVATTFAVACIALASWQIDRRSEAVSKIQRVSENYDLAPLDISDLSLVSLSEVVAQEWRKINLSGRYLSEIPLLVRNRAIAGQPGFVQLVPFKLGDGQVVIIERGWISADSNLDPSQELLPGLFDKDLVARVRLGEEIPNRDSPKGQLTSINLSEIEAMLGIELENDFYLRLVSESPPESSYPQPQNRPALDEGNHLSYAVQWIIFAVMGFFALFWAIRQEREYRKMELDPNYVPKSAKKTNLDSLVEDEILDRNS